MPETFGQYLRSERRKAGISQRQLAGQISVDFSYISKLENGRLPPPSARTVVAIAEALSSSREEFLARVGKIPSDIEEAISGSPGAQGFLQDAQLMALSDDEWREIRVALHKLRENS